MDQSIALLTIFVLAAFAGYEVISKVSTMVHTRLMSGADAIHGVILAGAVIMSGHADTPLELGLGTFAVVLVTLNIVGGVVVTELHKRCRHFGVSAKQPVRPAA
jgi:NAD(P) transhydrogenase subunit alpha